MLQPAIRNRTRDSRSAQRVFNGLIVLCLIAVIGTLAFPQLSPRTVKGVVMDRHGQALGGAVVQIEDLTSLQIRSFITQGDGKFYFCELSTERDYKLRARYRGVWGTAKTLSVFDSRKDATLNLKVDVIKEE